MYPFIVGAAHCALPMKRQLARLARPLVHDLDAAEVIHPQRAHDDVVDARRHLLVRVVVARLGEQHVQRPWGGQSRPVLFELHFSFELQLQL